MKVISDASFEQILARMPADKDGGRDRAILRLARGGLRLRTLVELRPEDFAATISIKDGMAIPTLILRYRAKRGGSTMATFEGEAAEDLSIYLEERAPGAIFGELDAKSLAAIIQNRSSHAGRATTTRELRLAAAREFWAKRTLH